MSQDFNINAQIRTDNGKGASRRLRLQGRIPAIVYGAEKEPQMISLLHDEILHATEDEAFFAHILNLDVDGNKEKVIVKDLQRHPAKVQIMHIDFQRINESKALHVHVPLHFINEEKSKGVKAGGIVTHLLTEIEITCLPANLPEFIEVNIADLEVGGSIHLSDLAMPEGVTNFALTQGEDHDLSVCNISLPRGEKESKDEDSEES